MNTYGDLSNAALLHKYGFTEKDNPYDHVSVCVAKYVMLVWPCVWPRGGD